MSERSVSKQKQDKRWYTVLAPEQFDRAELGQTVAEEPEMVVGRTVDTTLGEIENDQSANNKKLHFRITDVGSDSAYTEFLGYQLTRDYLDSLVRRGASKIAANVTVRTTDDYRVQLQPVAFTTQKADRPQERAIRAIMVDQVEEAAAERSFEELTDSVIGGRLSSAIYGEAKTIYPLRRVETEKLTLRARPEEIAAEEEAAVDVSE